ncbi:MAG: peptidoglycan-binding protein, partial [Candidatus Pacebacteria bacterium]|nr:peptidoglycan-binding protein [Candidatus Paceibacterota bacterium]
PSNTGSEYDMLYEFDDTTGSSPRGSLVESNGVFYGMTYNGGTNNRGVIFSYDPSNTGSEYDMLYEFDDTTGSYPYGSLVESNGVLYGMTADGGTDDAGVIFSYSENRAQIFDPENIFETGELKDNGGPVMTIALASDGPAIDSGNDAEAPETDARGYERYGVSDIGAYEYTPPEEPEEEEPQEEIQHSTTTSGSYRYIVNMSTPTIDTTPPTDCLPTYSFSPSTGKACPSSSFEQTQLYTPLTTSPLLLKFGMNNPLVSMLQNYLNTHGYPVAQTGAGSLNNETNYFGQKTLSAVKIFQTANNLVPDGVVGPKTREMMK